VVCCASDHPFFCLLAALSGLGIAIVNDFKSIEGDRKMGLQSLPVAFGVDTGEQTATHVLAGLRALHQMAKAVLCDHTRHT